MSPKQAEAAVALSHAQADAAAAASAAAASAGPTTTASTPQSVDKRSPSSATNVSTPPSAATPLASATQPLEESELSARQILEISEAVAVLAAASAVMRERTELTQLKNERAELLAQLLATRVGTVTGHHPGPLVSHHQSQQQQRHDASSSRTLRQLGKLDSQVSSLIAKLEVEISHVDEKIGSGLNLVDKDRDGIVTGTILLSFFFFLAFLISLPSTQYMSFKLCSHCCVIVPATMLLSHLSCHASTPTVMARST